MTSLFCLLLTACGNQNSAGEFKQLRYSGPTMGTQFNVSVVLQPSAPEPSDINEKVAARLDAINQRMSTYIDSSELSQLNRNDSDDWISVSDELFTLLELAQAISRESDGAFDITVGALVNLWGFGPDSRAGDSVPPDSAINNLMQTVGYEKLVLNREQRAVKKPAAIQLDLSAIAKGFAADEVSRLLLSLGYANHMVEVGGEVMAQGHNVRGQAWRIGIENPTFGRTGVQQAIATSGVGVATSGDYRNYFEIDGERYSHTIDPTTGRPITHKLASVTVIAPTAAQADAYATAINVLGFEAGKELAERRQLSAYFIVRNGDGFITEQTATFNEHLSQG